MKKSNIQKTLLLLIFCAIFSIVSTANAATASLYVSPASATKKVGDVINTTIGINTGANKIYAVEGTLVFDKLTCQSITVAAGLQALSTPSCGSPHFLLGIPGGSADNKVLLTVTTKAGATGTATISMTGVNIVGGDAVKSISNSGGSGSYVIESSEVVITPNTEAIPVVDNKTTVKKVSAKSGEVLGAKIEEKPTEGKVLAGFDEQTSTNAECSGLFASNTDKVVIGLLMAVIVLLSGFILFNKKKV